MELVIAMYKIPHPLLSSPVGLIYFKHILGGEGLETGTFLGFNLAKTMVSVLHKEPKYKEEKVQVKDEKLEVMHPRIKNKSELPVGE